MQTSSSAAATFDADLQLVKTELAILKRLLYKSKNQHKSTLHFRKLRQVRCFSFSRPAFMRFLCSYTHFQADFAKC